MTQHTTSPKGPSGNKESKSGPAKNEVLGPKPPVYNDNITDNKNTTRKNVSIGDVNLTCYAEQRTMGEVGWAPASQVLYAKLKSLCP
jgi:hypothetical protein